MFVVAFVGLKLLCSIEASDVLKLNVLVINKLFLVSECHCRKKGEFLKLIKSELLTFKALCNKLRKFEITKHSNLQS